MAYIQDSLPRRADISSFTDWSIAVSCIRQIFQVSVNSNPATFSIYQNNNYCNSRKSYDFKNFLFCLCPSSLLWKFYSICKLKQKKWILSINNCNVCSPPNLPKFSQEKVQKLGNWEISLTKPKYVLGTFLFFVELLLDMLMVG